MFLFMLLASHRRQNYIYFESINKMSTICNNIKDFDLIYRDINLLSEIDYT